MLSIVRIKKALLSHNCPGGEIERLTQPLMSAIATEQSSAVIPAWMPLIGGLVGTLKYLFLSLLAPVFGITLIIWSIATRQPTLSIGLGIIYLITFAMLGFSLYQLFTDVLPCLGLV